LFDFTTSEKLEWRGCLGHFKYMPLFTFNYQLLTVSDNSLLHDAGLKLIDLSLRSLRLGVKLSHAKAQRPQRNPG
jgi:hypothetical protein